VIDLRRSSIGVAAQAGNAAFAAATAWFSCAGDARGHSASVSSVAGLITSMVMSPGTIRPSIGKLKLSMTSSKPDGMRTILP
jgi:hypothetical protein